MLQQLKSPLLKDSQVPITLVFKDAKGETSRLSLQVPVRAMAPGAAAAPTAGHGGGQDRKSTRLNSSHSQISYAVFCLKKKKCNKPSSPTDRSEGSQPPPRRS